jgi:hypothetical protein
VCIPATGVHHQRRRELGVTPVQGTLQALTSTTCLYAKLDASLGELGFQCGEAKHAVYTHGVGGHQLIVGVYVNYLIIPDGNNFELKQFKGDTMSTFQMADLGRLHLYLGLEVNQLDEGITVSQGTYA